MQKGARFVYLFAVGLFLLGITVQVFLAGMVVVAMQMTWSSHIGLGHMLALPLIIMLITMYLGRMPRPIKPLTWLLFVVYALQADVIIFLRGQLPVISALHPVLALFDFAIAWGLARHALLAVRQPSEQPLAQALPGAAD